MNSRLSFASLKTCCALVLVCILTSCASAPKGFHVTKAGRPLVVKEQFEFTVVQGLAKVRHTFTLPSGTYPVYASDSRGTYFSAPKFRIPHKMGSFSDPLFGGIYRPNGTPPKYWIFGKAVTPLTTVIIGGVQLVAEIPTEHSPRISQSAEPSI